MEMNLKEIEWKGVFYVIWHRRGTYIGCYEHGAEETRSIKGGKHLE
jgi:hypothetical protein